MMLSVPHHGYKYWACPVPGMVVVSECTCVGRIISCNVLNVGCVLA